MLREILLSLKAHQGAPPGAVNGAASGAVTDVLAFLQAMPGSRANAIAAALDFPLRSVQRYLEQLKRENKIEFRGAPRNGGYYPTRKE